MKLKSCITKEMVSKLKRLSTEWENVFTSYTPDKRLITRIYRELKKPNSPPKSMNDPMKKWANELSRAFSKEEVQMNKNMKKMLTIPGYIRKCKSKPH
jgi:hypothetical protein